MHSATVSMDRSCEAMFSCEGCNQIMQMQGQREFRCCDAACSEWHSQSRTSRRVTARRGASLNLIMFLFVAAVTLSSSAGAIKLLSTRLPTRSHIGIQGAGPLGPIIIPLGRDKVQKTTSNLPPAQLVTVVDVEPVSHNVEIQRTIAPRRPQLSNNNLLLDTAPPVRAMMIPANYPPSPTVASPDKEEVRKKRFKRCNKRLRTRITVSHPGCESKDVDVWKCGGLCRSKVEPMAVGVEGRFASLDASRLFRKKCKCCQATRKRVVNVRLKCPQSDRPVRIMKVGSALQCGCMTCRH